MVSRAGGRIREWTLWSLTTTKGLKNGSEAFPGCSLAAVYGRHVGCVGTETRETPERGSGRLGEDLKGKVFPDDVQKKGEERAA